MTILRLLTTLIFISITAGCSSYGPPVSQPVASQVPVPTAYPLSTQPKMQAIQHWDILADDVSRKVIDFFEYNVFERHYPVYVAPGGTTPFEKAFHSLLITKLVERGIQVSKNSTSSMILSFDLQMVRHSIRTISTQRGVYRSLAPGMYVRYLSKTNPSPEEILSSESQVEESHINAEAGYFTHHLPNVEIMVTTSLARTDNYAMRTSSIYYINDSDWRNYKRNIMLEDPSVVNYRLVDR